MAITLPDGSGPPNKTMHLAAVHQKKLLRNKVIWEVMSSRLGQKFPDPNSTGHSGAGPIYGHLTMQRTSCISDCQLRSKIECTVIVSQRDADVLCQNTVDTCFFSAEYSGSVPSGFRLRVVYWAGKTPMFSGTFFLFPPAPQPISYQNILPCLDLAWPRSSVEAMAIYFISHHPVLSVNNLQPGRKHCSMVDR